MSNRPQIAEGFMLGLVLQAAIGPISLYIFSLAATAGISGSLSAVWGVTLADSLFIFLAITGITAFLRNARTVSIFRIIGSVVIALFGLAIILETLHLAEFPGISITYASSGNNTFLTGFLLTAGNPLTVLFWGGVCGVRMAESGMDRSRMYLFGTGAALSTLICQSLIAVAGAGTGAFMTDAIKDWLNICVGAALVGIAVWSFIKKSSAMT